jgi:hypothetical protein
MITIYKKTDNGLEPLMEPTIGSWINVIDPDGVVVLHETSDAESLVFCYAKITYWRRNLSTAL